MNKPTWLRSRVETPPREGDKKSRQRRAVINAELGPPVRKGVSRRKSTKLDRQVDLVRSLMRHSPAGKEYTSKRGDVTQVTGQHLRAVASAVGREYAYLAGGARDTARGVLEAVQEELQRRPNRCPECGDALPEGRGPGRCFTCGAAAMQDN